MNRTETTRRQLTEALAKLQSSDAWQNWLRARAQLRTYSFHNSLLIWQQRPDATICRGFKQWMKLNRVVRKGEKGIWIWAPMRVRDRDSDDPKARKLLFRPVAVFDVKQTEQIPNTDEIPLRPPGAPITGDSHADWLVPLNQLATDLGFTVHYRSCAGTGAKGWCDREHKEIVVGTEEAVNGRVRILLHELAHAHDVGYDEFGREDAEVIADSAAYLAAARIGLDVSSESLPYIAGFGGDDALERIERWGKKIDEIVASLTQRAPAEAEALAASP